MAAVSWGKRERGESVEEGWKRVPINRQYGGRALKRSPSPESPIYMFYVGPLLQSLTPFHKYSRSYYGFSSLKWNPLPFYFLVGLYHFCFILATMLADWMAKIFRYIPSLISLYRLHSVFMKLERKKQEVNLSDFILGVQNEREVMSEGKYMGEGYFLWHILCRAHQYLFTFKS